MKQVGRLNHYNNNIYMFFQFGLKRRERAEHQVIQYRFLVQPASLEPFFKRLCGAPGNSISIFGATFF
jgi:hypothetical protein